MNTAATAIRLRAMEPEDLDFLYSIENDTSLWGAGENNVPYSRYVLHDYIAHASADIYVDKQVRLIIENAEGTAVGIADLVNFSPANARAEVSIVVQKPFRRQGIARAAVTRLMAYARQTLHLAQLYAVVRTDNEASLRLFASMGFERSAMLRKWVKSGSTSLDAVVMQYFL